MRALYSKSEHCPLSETVQPKENPKSHVMTPLPPPPLQQVHTKSSRYARGKTFAEMVSDQCSMRFVVKPAPSYVDRHNCILTREVLSAQHISNIPTLLKLDSNTSGRIYYTGGLKMMIKFINPSHTNTFLADDSNWNRWFRWLKKRLQR